MLSENVYVNKSGYNIQQISRQWSFIWKCSCNKEFIITQDDIEDFIDSDPHDPLQDYLICPYCGKAYGLFNGVEGTTHGVPSKLWADGSFIYLTRMGRSIRVV